MAESELREQSAPVLKALEGTAGREDKALELWLRMCNADDGAIFPVDLVAKAAVKRCLSQSHALKLLIEGWNLLCARALVRMQIDTALRFFAIWLVPKPHKFAEQILKGEHVRRIKDRDGKPMTDAYLVSKLAPSHPWLIGVYESTSGYIHFSNEHLVSPIVNVQDETVDYEIGETDTTYPESSWLEVVQCFNAATDIFLFYLSSWIQRKEAGTGSK